jgi:hypothetical protein
LNVDEDGCIVLTELIDGVEVKVHHQIPDDEVPHAPTSECGCSPQVVHEGSTRIYLHVDQKPDDDAGELEPWD